MLHWQFDHKNASIDACNECKEQRKSRNACPGCPFSLEIEIDNGAGIFNIVTIHEIIHDPLVNYYISAYNRIEQAKEYGFTNTVLNLIGVDSEFGYFILMDMISHIKEIIGDHQQRQSEKVG